MRFAAFPPSRIAVLAAMLLSLMFRSANAAWGIDGAAVCNTTHGQTGAVAVPDGAGGVIVAWSDYRVAGQVAIYVQRLSPIGQRLWTANGILVSNPVRLSGDAA